MTEPGGTDYCERDGCIYVFLGTMGSRGLFRLDSRARVWTYHPANDKVWDSCHQETYANYKSRRLDADEIGRLPPLPPVPAVTSVRWEDNFALQRHGLLQDRGLVRWVSGAPGGSVPVWYVLYEDPYESSFGDGTFRYLQDVFVTRDAAQAWIDSKEAKDSGMKHHLRSLKLVWHVAGAGGAVELAEFSPQLFDQAKADEILEALKKKLPTS